MARRTHEYLITTPIWPTEWILDSVLMAWNDYLYTGNADVYGRAELQRHLRNAGIALALR